MPESFWEKKKKKTTHSAITVFYLKDYLYFRLKKVWHIPLKAPATEIRNPYMKWYHLENTEVGISLPL